MKNTHDDSASPGTETTEREQSRKIQSLREMITNAEQTIQSAKAMLLQIEGKKKVGRKRKIEEIEDGSVIQGTFDGQIMIGSDGKHYPVPANYASKSKLVQGDMLKLTITSDGSFIYKQIGPIDRKHAIGVVTQDENGNYFIIADGKAYHVLLASITYFHAEPGDEAAIMIPRDMNATWCAIENILQKASALGTRPSIPAIPKPTTDIEHWKKDVRDIEPIPPQEAPAAQAEEDLPAAGQSASAASTESEDASADSLRQEIIDEWMKEMEKSNPSEPAEKS